MVSHSELGSDPPIESDWESGRDITSLRSPEGIIFNSVL